MFNFKPIALVGGTVICTVGFLLFIPLVTEIIYQTESWQSYAVPILIYLIVGGSLVITNRNVELKISIKEAFLILHFHGCCYLFFALYLLFMLNLVFP